MSTEAQKRAVAKYQREKMKQINNKFSPNEHDLHEYQRLPDDGRCHRSRFRRRPPMKRHVVVVDGERCVPRMITDAGSSVVGAGGKRDLVGKTYTLTISGVTYNVPPNALTFIESPKEEGRSKIHEIAEEPVDRLPGTLDGEGCFSKRDRVNDIVKQLGVDIVAAINARN